MLVVSNSSFFIGVDSWAAHFSAALGKPTWILLPYSPDWRWMLESNKSYWYSCATLFRQLSPREWSSPLNTLQSALHELIKFRAQG